MRIEYLVGDATDPQVEGTAIIAHIVNDIGAWGSGFVVAISARWPEPEREYRKWHYWAREGGVNFQLGAVQYVPTEPGIVVANMVAQHDIRQRGAVKPLRLDALDKCLRDLAWEALLRDASVHMPRIGCDRGGGTWAEIEPLIADSLLDAGVPTYVYDLPTDYRGPGR